MIDDFLYSIPLYALFAFFILIFVGFTWVSSIIFHQFINQQVQLEDGAALSVMARPVSSTFAVLVAFMAIGTLNNFNIARDVVQQEAGLLNVILNNAAVLPVPVRNEIDLSLHRYIKSVIEEEWPAMNAGKVTGKAEKYLAAIYTHAAGYALNNSLETKALEQLISHLDDLVRVHQKRISLAQEGFPKVALIVLICCGFLVIVTSLFPHMKSRSTQLLAVNCVALAVALLISLVIGFDLPFRGPISIGNDPIVRQFDRINTSVLADTGQ